MAADVLQQFGLSAVLDAFGNDLQLQSATKLHDGFDDAFAEPVRLALAGRAFG